MKIMKKIFYLLFASAVFMFTSCEYEDRVYENSPVLAYFDGSAATLEVDLGSTNTLDINVGVSTLSTSDRTLSLSVVADDTNATAGMYSFPSTVTIPANAYTGSFTVTGIDDGLTTAGATLTIQIDGIDGTKEFSTNNFAITLLEVCPVDETLFVGDYLLEQLSPFTDGPTLSDGSVVTLTADGLSRSFDTEFFPLYCSGSFSPFSFTLVCNETLVGNQDNPCNCDTGADWFGPPTDSTNGTYDVTDDSVLTIRFVDDSSDECGLGTANTEYRLTKQ